MKALVRACGLAGSWMLISIPLMAQFPDPARLTGLPAGAIQQTLQVGERVALCVGGLQAECQVVPVAGPDFALVSVAASGGNKYDSNGVLWTAIAVGAANTTERRIYKIFPTGAGAQFALAPVYHGLNCQKLSASQFSTDSDDTIDFAFNLQQNALYVTTVTTRVVYSLPAGAVGSCSETFPFGFQPPAATYYYAVFSTYALLSVRNGS